MLTDRPRIQIQSVPCDSCNGSGRQASEWDCATGAVVALKVCTSCMGRGVIRANVPAPSCAA